MPGANSNPHVSNWTLLKKLKTDRIFDDIKEMSLVFLSHDNNFVLKEHGEASETHTDIYRQNDMISKVFFKIHREG